MLACGSYRLIRASFDICRARPPRRRVSVDITLAVCRWVGAGPLGERHGPEDDALELMFIRLRVVHAESSNYEGLEMGDVTLV